MSCEGKEAVCPPTIWGRLSRRLPVKPQCPPAHLPFQAHFPSPVSALKASPAPLSETPSPSKDHTPDALTHHNTNQWHSICTTNWAVCKCVFPVIVARHWSNTKQSLWNQEDLVLLRQVINLLALVGLICKRGIKTHPDVIAMVK